MNTIDTFVRLALAQETDEEAGPQFKSTKKHETADAELVQGSLPRIGAVHPGPFDSTSSAQSLRVSHDRQGCFGVM